MVELYRQALFDAIKNGVLRIPERPGTLQSVQPRSDRKRPPTSATPDVADSAMPKRKKIAPVESSKPANSIGASCSSASCVDFENESTMSYSHRTSRPDRGSALREQVLASSPVSTADDHPAVYAQSPLSSNRNDSPLRSIIAPFRVNRTSSPLATSISSVKKDWSKVDHLKGLISSPRGRCVGSGDLKEDQAASYATRRFRKLGSEGSVSAGHLYGSQQSSQADTVGNSETQSQSQWVGNISTALVSAAGERLVLDGIDFASQSSPAW